MKNAFVLAAGAMMLAGCVTTYSVTPVDTGAAKVTYYKGKATTDLELANGAIKITPLGVAETGRLSFAVAGYNKALEPANFGTENFNANVGGATVRVFTYAQLEKEAKTAATWAAVAVAVSGAGAAIAANNNAYSTTNTTMYTPRGVYTAQSRTYNSTAAALNTAAASAATAGGLYSIKKNLDDTLDELGNSILQTTTVEPNTAYGGQIVVEKPKASAPYMVEVKAHWNGEEYAFRFNVEADK